MTPGKGEISAGAGHFKGSIENRIENPENPEALDFDVLDEGVDKCRYDTVGTEEGNQSTTPKKMMADGAVSTFMTLKIQ